MPIESQDQLDLGPRAAALARLITDRATATPLAVALMAEWGGGKTAFLRLLGDAVERLAASGDPRVADRVTVVRFNAWHRSDRSVLVGIVDRVVEAFQDQDGEGAARSAKRGTRRRARRRAAAVGWLERLDEREERLGRDADHPAPGPLAALWRRVRLVALVPWALAQGSWRSATLLTATLVVALALVAGPYVLPLLAPELMGWLTDAESWVNGALASSGVAALATAVVAVYRVRVSRNADGDEATGSLAGLITSTIQQEREKAEERIAEIDAENATTGIADLLHEGDRRDRLDAARGFVGHLGSELGDFADQVARAEEYWRRRARADGAHGTDRVILLIDDLDRVAPERVVEVLHALATLQYTSLFVVVVAADPAWVRRAVERAGATTGAEESHLEGYIDDALDYLDTAFHVPYAIPRTVRSDGGRYLLTVAEEQGLVASGDDTGTDAADLSDAASPSDVASWSGGDPELAVDRGSRTSDETRILAAVSGVLPNPRAVKKFLVLYRLLRMSTHDHGPVAVLLALLVGMPVQALRVLTELDHGADGRLIWRETASYSSTFVV